MSMVKRFSRNLAGHDFIVGDIHGNFTRLQSFLDSIGFRKDVDRLFSVGDLVDCGPESHQALEWIGYPWFHAVAGNHEDMAIRWPNGNMDAGNYEANGGAWNVANTDAERWFISDALSALPIAIELETEQGIIGIVHADCPCASWKEFVTALDDPLTPRSKLKSLIDCAQWLRMRIEYRLTGGVADVRAVVVGHTPLLKRVVLGNVHHIDTGGWFPVHKGGYFTVLHAETLLPIGP